MICSTHYTAQQDVNWRYPAIESYGPVVPVPNASARPEQDISYKVVFNITGGTPGDGRVSPDLALVARFVNLLALSGMGDFSRTSDEEVIDLLARSQGTRS